MARQILVRSLDTYSLPERANNRVDLNIFHDNEAANRWRSVTFQTLAAAAADGASGNLIQLGRSNVTNVTEQILSLLSAVSGSQLQGGLQGEMRKAASLAVK